MNMFSMNGKTFDKLLLEECDDNDIRIIILNREVDLFCDY